MNRLVDWARRPVDASSLAVFRICVGVICAWEVSRYFRAGWIEEFWEQPQFHFHYVGFGWVRPLAGPGLIALPARRSAISCSVIGPSISS